MVKVHMEPKLGALLGAVAATVFGFYLFGLIIDAIPPGASNNRVGYVITYPLMAIWAHTLSVTFDIGTLADTPVGKVIRGAAWLVLVLGGLTTLKAVGGL